MQQNNLILFATYWNAIDWIDASLAQIDKINPKEIIICDGCFDLKKPIHSSDGTKEKIEEFVSNRPHARMISPVRTNKFWGAIRLLFANKPFYKIFTPARLKILLRALLCHHYRVNQALTFNKMISLSKEWKPDGWFMNYDCDQFYSDKVLENFKLCNEKNSEYSQLTATENTFFNNMQEYTDQYEKRNFNNMPHKIFNNTSIITTRDIVREDFFDFAYYKDCEVTKDIGTYNHYKITNTERFKQGYQLGDRKMPDYNSYKTNAYEGEHPSIIKEFFDLTEPLG